ncbi:MAG: major facilitator superfamily MFS_1 [Candidatus Parvarchaeum acidiphilum ARMAN-4]|jgi:EmrB/QacA subfamily drug resistance transporter|uniref:Major facilitator superfamily MFS_1 n=1 Tax=Candidatus Parvarchaeum acidiphilum ARMAN-4 TaxID=662760 RepID=D2EEE1_PARA4|nr:MAG: major facilitator superfamily MFS_1 [Candidatus Parvarchaeum acidiphilum ARMAN-4]
MKAHLAANNGDVNSNIKNENLILSVLVIGVLMASIDSTIVLLAFPAITQALHSNLSTVIWVILIYLLITAVAATQLGRIGDLFGRSRVFNSGIAIFTFFSFMCGIAPTDITLIIFRGFQAIGGAMMTANSGAIIADTFRREKLGKAYGFTGMGWNVGAMLGIVLGGIITTFIGYRYIFFINVPIGIVLLVLALKYIKDNKRENEKLDIAGMGILGVMLSMILYAGVRIASVGLDTVNISILVIGFILILPFYFREKIFVNPVIKFSMFKNKVFKNSVLASMFQGLGFMGVAFMLIMYLQGVRGLSPFNASLLLLPGYVLSGVLSPFMGRYSDKYGARLLATLGLLVMIAGITVYFALTATSSVYIVLIGSAITGFGGAMFWPANNSAVMKSSEAGRFGTASGVLRLFGSIGIMGSFIIVIVTATLAIPRYLAFEIFVGTSKLIGGITKGFITGMHFSFVFLIIMLVIAALLSLTRGNENIGEKIKNNSV